MPHLRSVSLRPSALAGANTQRFPFSVPIIRELPELPLSPTVTFLVGENGSGKSTLLEGIAAAAEPAGGRQRERGPRRDARRAAQARQRAEAGVEPPRAARLLSPRRGFFRIHQGAVEDARRAARAAGARSTSRWRIGRPTREGLAKGPLAVVARRHGAAVRRQPRRELARPELSQALSVAVRAGRVVSAGRTGSAAVAAEPAGAIVDDRRHGRQDNAQFIIATHSPILLGFPGATIYSCDQVPMARVEYEELDHVVITRDFLNARERFLKYLY